MSATVGCLPTLKVQQQSLLSKQCSECERFPQQGRSSVLEWKSSSLNFPLTSPFLWELVSGHLRHLHGRSAVNCKSCFCFGAATAPQHRFLPQDTVCFEGLCLLLRNRYRRAQGIVKSGNVAQECSASKPALKEVRGKLLFPWLEKEQKLGRAVTQPVSQQGLLSDKAISCSFALCHTFPTACHGTVNAIYCCFSLLTESFQPVTSALTPPTAPSLQISASVLHSIPTASGIFVPSLLQLWVYLAAAKSCFAATETDYDLFTIEGKSQERVGIPWKKRYRMKSWSGSSPRQWWPSSDTTDCGSSH